MLRKGLFILTFLVQLSGTNTNVTPDTAVLCYFGSGDGQVGIEIGNMQYGPFDFAIDEQKNVYISDYYNNRVIKFNTEGQAERYYYPPEARWIAVREGRIYIGDGSIWVYDTSGDFLKELKGAGYPRVDRYGNLYAYFSDGLIIFNEDFDTVAVAYRPFPSSSANPLWSGDKYIFLSSDKELTIWRLDLSAKGKVLERIKSEIVIRCNPYSTGFSAGWIEGEDEEGNIYVQGYEKNIVGGVVFIKLSPEGEFLGQLVVSYRDWEIWGDLGHAVRVSPRGDLYLANMDKEKYWIMRYPTEMFRKP